MSLRRLGKFLIPYFVLASILSVALYFALDRQSVYLTNELVNYWKELAQKDIQSGNIYQSISKNYRVINTSQSLEAIKVFEKGSQKELLSIGHSELVPQLGSENSLLSYGFFKYQKAVELPGHLRAYFFISSSFYKWLFVAGLIVLFLPLSILGVIHFRYSQDLANKKQKILLDSLRALFEGRRTESKPHLDKDLESSWHLVAEKFEELLEMEKSYLGLEEKFKLSKKVAHDIRTPLQALNMAADNLETNPETAKKLIRSSSERINKVAEDLLQSNRNDVEKGAAEESLKTNLENLIEELKLKAQKSNIILSSSLSGSDSSIDADLSSDFTRHLSNLIANAIEATPQNQDIYIHAEIDNKKISGCLKDKGIGMSEKVLRKALSGNFTTKEKGNGIGLSSAKEFFESSNGRFSVSSQEGFGTEIHFEMPL